MSSSSAAGLGADVINVNIPTRKWPSFIYKIVTWEYQIVVPNNQRISRYHYNKDDPGSFHHVGDLLMHNLGFIQTLENAFRYGSSLNNLTTCIHSAFR